MFLMKYFFDRISQFVIWLASAALIALVGLMAYQVWGRYVLNDTPTWAESLALLLILVVVLPVAAVGLRENFHLGITFFIDSLSSKGRRSIEILTIVILFGFGAMMAVHSWELVAGTWGRKIPLLGLPQGVKFLPLVFCGCLICLFMIERVLGLITSESER